jgi:hypothetical protein
VTDPVHTIIHSLCILKSPLNYSQFAMSLWPKMP